MRFLRLAVLSLAAALTVLADKITLNDGRTYEGSILEETETHLKIKTAKATLTLAKKDVAEVTRGGASPILERVTRLEALSPANPDGYLETAEWLCKDGRGAMDAPILRRLCNISAVFDRKTACRAQLLLGRELFTMNDRPGSAKAYIRAHNADPEDPEAKKKSEEMRQEIEAVMKKEMTELQAILDVVLSGNYTDAVTKMKRAKLLSFADQAPDYMGVTMGALADDLQRRVPCKACNGLATAACDTCKGRASIPCKACDGTGKKKGGVAPAGGSTSMFATACRTCVGMGSTLCAPCKSERTVTVSYLATGGHAPVSVSCVAGKEREALREAVDLTKFIKPGTDIAVTSITPNSTTAGGRRACVTCRGILFDPPPTSPDLAGVRKFRDAINDRLEGRAALDVEGRAGGVYDEELLEDGCYYYRNGKWVESEETK